jgi:hypothetical protein
MSDRILTPEQMRKFNNLRRSGRQDEAKAFRDSIVAQQGAAPTPAAPTPAAPLTPEQKKEFFSIRRTQGADAARDFRQGIIAGAPGTPPTPAAPGTPPPPAAPAAPGTPPPPPPAAPGTPPPPGTPPGTGGVESLTDRLATQTGEQALNSGAFTPPEFSIQNFEDQRRTLEQNAIASFDSANQKFFDQARQQLEQQMANEGLPPGSEQYNRRMQALMETQSQQRQQAVRDAYSSSFTAAQEAQQLDITQQGQLYDQSMQTYRTPYELTMGFNELGLKGQALKQDQSQFESRERLERDLAATENQLKRDLDANRLALEGELKKGDWANNERIVQLKGDIERDIKRMDNKNRLRVANVQDRSSRATAGAGTLSVADRLRLIQEESAQRREDLYVQQALRNVDMLDF